MYSDFCCSRADTMQEASRRHWRVIRKTTLCEMMSLNMSAACEAAPEVVFQASCQSKACPEAVGRFTMNVQHLLRSLSELTNYIFQRRCRGVRHRRLRQPRQDRRLRM